MLTDKQCKAAKPAERPQKLFDGGGLHLLVLPSGTKSWRLKYRFGGKEKQLTFGIYPAVSLKEAREARDEAKKLLSSGIDPAKSAQERRDRRAGRIEPRNTFKSAAMRWHELQSHGWKERHASNVLRALEQEVFPSIGDREIAELKPSDIRPLVDTIQDRGAVDQAHRTLMRISRIFQLAIVDELVEIDPAASLTAILKPVPKHKYPAILKLPEACGALARFEQERHWPQIKLASRLMALAVPRPGPLRFAQPGEFHDLDGAEPVWIIPAAKMKLDLAQSGQKAFDFTIPLSKQAAAVAKVAIEAAGKRPYLFPAVQRSHRPISENALNKAYRDSPEFAGRHVPHGWRSTFSTIMNERAADLDRPGDRAILDLMLAHKPKGVEAHYNRAAYLPRRRLLAQEWADMLSVDLIPAEQLLEGPRN